MAVTWPLQVARAEERTAANEARKVGDIVGWREEANAAGEVAAAKTAVCKRLSSALFAKQKQLLKDEFNLRFFKLSAEEDAQVRRFDHKTFWARFGCAI